MQIAGLILASYEFVRKLLWWSTRQLTTNGIRTPENNFIRYYITSPFRTCEPLISIFKKNLFNYAEVAILSLSRLLPYSTSQVSCIWGVQLAQSTTHSCIDILFDRSYRRVCFSSRDHECHFKKLDTYKWGLHSLYYRISPIHLCSTSEQSRKACTPGMSSVGRTSDSTYSNLDLIPCNCTESALVDNNAYSHFSYTVRTDTDLRNFKSEKCSSNTVMYLTQLENGSSLGCMWAAHKQLRTSWECSYVSDLF